jgi:DNA ligase-1
VLLADLVTASTDLSATRSRGRKTAILAACLQSMTAEEVAVGTSYLSGRPRQERLDVGWRTIRSLDTPPAAEPSLTVLAVHDALERLAQARGAGSRAAKAVVLTDLMGAATDAEQDFLGGLILGELRQGALEGIVAQAVAQAWELPEPAVRRAWMVCGDLPTVAATAASSGLEGLEAFALTLFRPLQPMLAQTAESVTQAITELGRAVVDFKLDGARIQVHRDGDEVRVYTRNLRDVTARSPEVVSVTRALAAQQIVLDGEVIALRPDGRPHHFQDTMARFGSDFDESTSSVVALVPFFFDCLHIDGQDLLDEPLDVRRASLCKAVPPDHLVRSVTVDDAAAGEDVLRQALEAGHEGVVVKDPSTVYEAGRRGAGWRKVKPTHTLDLVVLAVEWGSGRRHGWLSNLHLGARDPDGGFVMLGKTFKGMTDAMLEWQTAKLLELETHRDGHVVHVRPELVVEIAFDGVQASTRYPGGVALRFARVKAYREDKSADQADTIDAVRALRAT